MKGVEFNNYTSKDIHVKVLINLGIVEVKSRSMKYVSVDDIKDIDTIIVNIKE